MLFEPNKNFLEHLLIRFIYEEKKSYSSCWEDCHKYSHMSSTYKVFASYVIVKSISVELYEKFIKKVQWKTPICTKFLGWELL